MKIMTFFLGDQSYAVDLSAVSGVASRGDSPAATPLDLAALLGASGGDRPGGAALLVLRGEGGDVVVRVDRLGEVLEVDGGAVRAVPTYFDSPVLRGLVATENGLVVLLDASRLLGGEARAAAGVSGQGGAA